MRRACGRPAGGHRGSGALARSLQMRLPGFSGGGHGQAEEPPDGAALAALLPEAWRAALSPPAARQASELTGYGTAAVNERAPRGRGTFAGCRSAHLSAKESLGGCLASPAGQRGL
jgi:hypothetical protein